MKSNIIKGLLIGTALSLMLPTAAMAATYDYSAGTESGGTVVYSKRKWGQALKELLATEPTKTGYSFAGWFTNPTDDGTQITVNTIMPSDDLEVYAHWTPNQYMLTASLINSKPTLSDGTNTVNGVDSVENVKVDASRTIHKSTGDVTSSLTTATLTDEQTTKIRFDDAVTVTPTLKDSFTSGWYYYNNNNNRHKAHHEMTVSDMILSLGSGTSTPTLRKSGSNYLFNWTSPGNLTLLMTGRDEITWTNEQTRHTPSITSVTITSTDLEPTSDGENYSFPQSVTFYNSSGSYDCQVVNNSARFHYTWWWNGASYSYSIYNSGSSRMRRFQLTFNCNVGGVINNTVDQVLYEGAGTSAGGSATIPDVWQDS